MHCFKIFLVLISISMMSAVDGINIGISCGTSNNGHGTLYGSHVNVGNDVDVKGQFSLQGDNLVGGTEYKGSGKLDVDETKSNVAGDSVTLIANGQLNPGNDYKSWWSDSANPNYFSGTQSLKGKGSDIYCSAQATDRDGIFSSSVSAGVGKGSIDILQGAIAQKNDANAWQKINSAFGENIKLTAETSDIFKDSTNSIVTIDSGSIDKFNSESEGSILTGAKGNQYVDVYSIHGAFEPVDNKVNPVGSISGGTINFEGFANSQGNTAGNDVTIKDGTIKGRFDTGNEVRQGLLQGITTVPVGEGWVISVPLESPAAWGGASGNIKISACRITSTSEANGISDGAHDVHVSVNNWAKDHGFADPSEAGLDPSI